MIGPEARSPDHRAELLALEVETQTRRVLDSSGRMPLSLGHLSMQSFAVDPLVDPTQQTRELQIRHGAVIAQRSGELQLAAVRAHDAPDESDATRGQRIQIECRPLGRSDELRR